MSQTPFDPRPYGCPVDQLHRPDSTIDLRKNPEDGIALTESEPRMEPRFIRFVPLRPKNGGYVM
jgi:hypothetical protein